VVWLWVVGQQTPPPPALAFTSFPLNTNDFLLSVARLLNRMSVTVMC